MNIREFKAWFAGYTEGKDSLSPEQLARVKEEMDRISLLGDVPNYPQPSLPGYWPPQVVTRTPTRVNDNILWNAWNACDPAMHTACSRP
jgi:hypothetical protein